MFSENSAVLVDHDTIGISLDLDRPLGCVIRHRILVVVL
jgi:hypothetical protein